MKILLFFFLMPTSTALCIFNYGRKFLIYVNSIFNPLIAKIGKKIRIEQRPVYII